ncbi:hypothetical protein ACP4OV_022419 [Aristida adscensionis]
MGGDQGKLMKTLRGAGQKYLGVGFLLGFFLVLLTYFTVSEQFAISAPNAIRRTSPGHARSSPATPAVKAEKQQLPIIEHEPPKAEHEAPKAEHAAAQEKPPAVEEPHTQTEVDQRPLTVAAGGDGGARERAPAKKPACDIQGPWAADVCDIAGDVRIHGSAHAVVIPPSIESGGNPNPQEWRILPYSRKHMGGIKEVTVRELAAAADAPACDVRSPVPALVFAMGGLTGNYWHDFSDVLIPLYLQAVRFGGEVQLVVDNLQPWYAGKYRAVLRRLSRYDVVDMDRDDKVRCFPGAVVGIRMHKEFSIDPAREPAGHSMPEFTKFLRATFSLPRDAPLRLAGAGDDATRKKKPRMMVISRRHPRRLVNVGEVVAAAERVGFEVVIGDPPFNVDVGAFAREVNAADVLVGVHGAGLTNSLFLPTGAVLVQVVPYGKMEHIGEVDFGVPAVDMGLRYIAYSAGVEESTLVETLGRDHPAVRDPESVHRQGWGKVAEYYLGTQDIKLDLARFEPVLRKAMQLLRE